MDQPLTGGEARRPAHRAATIVAVIMTLVSLGLAGVLIWALITRGTPMPASNPLATSFSAAVGPCPPALPPVPINPSHPAIVAALSSVQTLLQGMVAQGVPGISCAATYGSQALVSQGLGLANSTTGQPVTGDTTFRIGSGSKVFTVLMGLILEQRGVLSLDDPVTRFLPSFRIQNPFPNATITLRMLGEHTAGVPREACTGLLCGSDQTAIFNYLATQSLILPPYSRTPAYSNLGVALLGHALEAAAGVSVDQFLQENVFAPLGMTATGYSTDPAKFAYCSAALSAWWFLDIGWTGPAGQMYSSANDMLKFLAFLVSGNTMSGTPVLPPTVVRQWLRTVTAFPNAVTGFGMPWETVFLDGKWVFSKAGAVPGYGSCYAAVPSLNLGVSTFASAGVDGTAMCAPMLNTLMPAVQTAMSDAVAALYAGVYALGGVTATVSVQGGVMYLQYSTVPGMAPLLWSYDHTFYTYTNPYNQPGAMGQLVQSCMLTYSLIDAYVGNGGHGQDQVVFVVPAGSSFATQLTTPGNGAVYVRQSS